MNGNMKTEKVAVIIAVMLISMVIIGEVAVHTQTNRYSSSASVDGDILSYSISGKGSNNYSVIVTDGMERLDALYIYYDTSYGTALGDSSAAVGARPLTLDYYVQQLVNVLRSRGVTNVTMLGADELAARMTADTVPTGLVVLSGALPATIYSGLGSDLIFDWLDKGGRLYWAGNLLGKYIAVPGGVSEVLANYQGLFFAGANGCLNDTGTDVAFSGVGNQYRDALSLLNNHVRYGVSTNALTLAGVDHLAMGYCENGYSSIVFFEHGTKGTICVIGGDHTNDQRTDLAQVIAANLGHSSNIIGTSKGTFKGSAGSDIDVTAAIGNLSVYMFVGGAYTAYGRLYSFTV